jgi:hypothetical protein
MREQLSKRLDPVPTEYAPLPSPATPAAGPEPAGEAAPETLPKIVSEAAVQSLPGSRVVPDTNPAREPQGPAALQTAKGTARERVSQFLDDLREILSGEERLRAEMRALRAAAQSAREKVSVAERDLCRAEQTARQAIDERDRERAERSAAEGQVELLRAEIAKLHADSDAARHAHGREADSLAARIGVEADRSVEGFKNSLVGKLRLEWRDFSDVREKEMDVALGESLRRQLRGLFSVLEHAGFSFKD